MKDDRGSSHIYVRQKIYGDYKLVRDTVCISIAKEDLGDQTEQNFRMLILQRSALALCSSSRIGCGEQATHEEKPQSTDAPKSLINLCGGS